MALEDDKTVQDSFYYAEHSGENGAVLVSWLGDDNRHVERKFTEPFRFGRGENCEVQIADARVSKLQAEVYHDGEQWFLRDLGSAHGTFVNGVRITQAPLPAKSSVQFRPGGPSYEISVEGAVDLRGENKASVTQVVKRYSSEANSIDDIATTHTRLLRLAFKRVKRVQSRRYLAVIGAISLLLVGAIGAAIYNHQRLLRATELYVGIFYDMNELNLQIARLEQRIEATGDVEYMEDIGVRRERLRVMQQRYDAFLQEIGLAGEALSEQERIIFRVARMFGECELNMPRDFVDEVKNYIGKWRSTPRLAEAMQRLDPAVHIPLVYREMLSQHLPPQFLFLALQESDFNMHAVGPPTRFGIAKGAWQFVPSTAHRYGLKTGPLIEMPVYDPADQRFDFGLATNAAARYLKDIYQTDAQASGLLVLASYNWGPGNIRRLIRQMPENPRERNFWKLLSQHPIPQQTYDYVFYIISAVVIGEQPRLFGFDFDNPFADLTATLAQERERLSHQEDGGLEFGADAGSQQHNDAAPVDSSKRKKPPQTGSANEVKVPTKKTNSTSQQAQPGAAPASQPRPAQKPKNQTPALDPKSQTPAPTTRGVKSTPLAASSSHSHTAPSRKPLAPKE